MKEESPSPEVGDLFLTGKRERWWNGLLNREAVQSAV